MKQNDPMLASSKPDESGSGSPLKRHSCKEKGYSWFLIKEGPYSGELIRVDYVGSGAARQLRCSWTSREYIGYGCIRGKPKTKLAVHVSKLELLPDDIRITVALRDFYRAMYRDRSKDFGVK